MNVFLRSIIGDAETCGPNFTAHFPLLKYIGRLF